MKTTNRRGCLGRRAGFCAAAGAIAGYTSGLLAQIAAGKLRRPGSYEENSLILDRKSLTWLGGKTLAVWFAPNVEEYLLAPGGNPNEPDVLNFANREYGMRVGLWRIADVMDQAKVRATVALNASVYEIWPKAIATVINNTLKIIQQATGKKVRGWLGTGLVKPSILWTS